jgi:hypothetical protein
VRREACGRIVERGSGHGGKHSRHVLSSDTRVDDGTVVPRLASRHEVRTPSRRQAVQAGSAERRVAPNWFRGDTLGVCRLLRDRREPRRSAPPLDRVWFPRSNGTDSQSTARRVFPSHTDLSYALKSWRAITSSGRPSTASGRHDSKKHDAGPENAFGQALPQIHGSSCGDSHLRSELLGLRESPFHYTTA